MHKLEYPRVLTSPSVIVLIVANMVPIIGVLFFGLGLSQIFILYWLEGVLFAFFNSVKMVIVAPLASIFYIPFFLAHYVLTMIVYLAFIEAFFAPKLELSSLFPSTATITNMVLAVSLPIAVLFISHLVSFFYNFIGKREYKLVRIGRLMYAPYERILLMQITIIVGGLLLALLKEPIIGLAVLIALKTIADIHAHSREHSLNKKEVLT